MKFNIVFISILLMGICSNCVQNKMNSISSNSKDANHEKVQSKPHYRFIIVKVKIADRLNDFDTLDKDEINVLNNHEDYKSINIKVLSIVSNPSKRHIPSSFNFRLKPNEYNFIGIETYLLLDVPEKFDKNREYQIYPMCGLSTSIGTAEAMIKNYKK